MTVPSSRDPAAAIRDDAELLIAMLSDGAYEYAKGLERDARSTGDDRWRHYERVAAEIARMRRAKST